MRDVRNIRNRRKAIQCDFTFNVRAEPVPAELRPEWRIALLLLMIARCGWNNSMSLKKAHLVCSAAASEESRAMLLRLVSGERYLDDVPLRIDPALNRAIEYAIGERIVEARARNNTLVLALTDSGKEFVREIIATPDCMDVEKDFAEQLRGNLPNEKVEEILDWETTL